MCLPTTMPRRNMEKSSRDMPQTNRMSPSLPSLSSNTRLFFDAMTANPQSPLLHLFRCGNPQHFQGVFQNRQHRPDQKQPGRGKGAVVGNHFLFVVLAV